MEIVCKIKPIFEDLSKDELLQRCLHGRTQNANESFNGMIWERVAHFNIGWKASVLVYEKLSVVPVRYCAKGFDSLNRKRLFNASFKGSEKTRKRCKILRGKLKSKGDKIGQKEGVLYEAGAF